MAEELKKIQQAKEASEREQARVSLSEPEARLMKHGDNAFAPSYNVQISTDAKEKVIVGVHLSQNSGDAESLPEAVAEIENNLGRKPKQMVVDGGFTNQGSMEAMTEKKIELMGSLRDPAERRAASLKAMGIEPEFGSQFFILDQATNTLECPAHCRLEHMGQSRKNGNRYQQYQARRKTARRASFGKNAARNRRTGALFRFWKKKTKRRRRCASACRRRRQRPSINSADQWPSFRMRG